MTRTEFRLHAREALSALLQHDRSAAQRCLARMTMTELSALEAVAEVLSLMCQEEAESGRHLREVGE